jgi:hypothetical protein
VCWLFNDTSLVQNGLILKYYTVIFLEQACCFHCDKGKNVNFFLCLSTVPWIATEELPKGYQSGGDKDV